MDQRLGRIEGQLDRLDDKIDQVQRRMLRVLVLVAAAITAVLAIVQVVAIELIVYNASGRFWTENTLPRGGSAVSNASKSSA